MEFTNNELADMHFCYGLANGSNPEALRLYQERFPDRQMPGREMFATIHRRLCEDGRFGAVRDATGSLAAGRQINVEEVVLRQLENDPSLSTRRLATEHQVSQSTIWRIISNAGYYPYHLQRVQALYPGDKIRRLNFCNWFLNQPQHGNDNFASAVLFTDEAEFTRDGINNFHNQHLWSIENPHGVVESKNQIRFSLNVWAGIVGNTLIGPVFLEPRLNGQIYHRFLSRTLPPLLDDIPLAVRQRMWFMHDGAPAHFSRLARNYLSQPQNYGNNWIGRGGPVEWPARSPDLNPLDFYLWGHCKALVYDGAIANVDELRQRIIDAFDRIRNMDGIFRRINGSMYRRLEACVLANGGHFEQLL